MLLQFNLPNHGRTFTSFPFSASQIRSHLTRFAALICTSRANPAFHFSVQLNEQENRSLRQNDCGSLVNVVFWISYLLLP